MMNIVASLRVSDRLWGLDPGGLRLRNALRSTAATTLTGIISVVWALRHDAHPTVAALAILFAMIAPLFVRETTRAGFTTTLVWVYLTASASYLCAAALGPDRVVGDIGFLFVFFGGILCQACGPRALGCALSSIVTYYLGLYLAPTASQVSQSLLLSLPALLIVTLVVRVILPVKPDVILQRAIKAVLVRATDLETLLRKLPTGSVRLNRQISSLNEAALALEEHLSLLPLSSTRADAIRERLVELEVAAGQCHYAQPLTTAEPLTGLSGLREAMGRLGETIHGPKLEKRLQTPGSHSPLSGAQLAQTPSFSAKWQDFTSRLSWLHAGRATTAAIIAMLLGHSLSPERWFWAVISTFVVFLGTRSRADTIHRGLERVGGTLTGAFVSAVLALTFHGNTPMLLLAMVLCVFGWSYFILNSYSRGVFFITVLVGLVYSELGFAIGPLVAIRIEEVLLGCVISFAVAAFVFPVSASGHIDVRVLGVLKALRSVVDTHARGLPAANTQRQLEKRWHELRVAFRPFQTQRVFVWNPDCEMVSGALLACLHWARTFNASALTAANAHRFDTVSRQLNGLIRQYGIDVEPDAISPYRVTGDVQDHVANGSEALEPMPSSAISDDLARQTHALTQLEACISQLSDRLNHSPEQGSNVRWAMGTTGG